jgi:hypothetical protein
MIDGAHKRRTELTTNGSLRWARESFSPASDPFFIGAIVRLFVFHQAVVVIRSIRCSFRLIRFHQLLEFVRAVEHQQGEKRIERKENG